MEKEKIIIIGAGLSGMAAGCYAQMNGYDTEIFEMHFLPGGCCTAWDRGEYTFDATIEWLLGSGENSILREIWNDIGGLDGKNVKHFEAFNNYMSENGEIVSFYCEPEKLRTHLKNISVEDGKLIDEFCDSLANFGKINEAISFRLLKPEPLWTDEEKQSFFKKTNEYPELFTKSLITNGNVFWEKFKSPLLKEALKHIILFNQPNFPLLVSLYNLRACTEKDAGFPEGGSLGLARSIEKRYLELGGKINYIKKVEKIITKNDRALGVEIDDGTVYHSDFVISACDGFTTIKKLLSGKYTNKMLDLLYNDYVKKEPDIVYPSMVIQFFGVNRDLKNELHSISLKLNKDELNNFRGICQSDSLLVQVRTNHSAEFAPAGKSVIGVYYFSTYGPWKEIYKDKSIYDEEKRILSQKTIKYLEKIYKGIGNDIETIDVSTPMTMERYTGTSLGAVMAWHPFKEAEKLVDKFANESGMRIPNLKNCYHTGMWVSLGGLIRCASSGRHVIQFLMRDNEREFQALRRNNHVIK